MTSVRDFTKRVFGTSKIMTAVAVTMIVAGTVMSGIFVAGWVSKEQKEEAVEQRSIQPSSASGPAASSTPTAIYTLAQVAEHSSANDCWMVIGTSVYDVSSFLSQHPGGVQSMSPYCGKDGTKAFETMDKGRGQTHSQSASMLKEDYKIGTLAN